MTGKKRALSPFELWLVSVQNVLEATALTYADDLDRLMSVATVDEILHGDLEELVQRHPTVARATKHRSRRAGPLRRAGRLFREFTATAPAMTMAVMKQQGATA